MRVLVVDNLDSFTWNLAQVLAGLGATVEVRRAGTAPADLAALEPDRVVLSPGPGHPDAAAGCLAALRAFEGRVPVLGVCLGLQVLARRFGVVVGRVEPRHGRRSLVRHDARGVFAGLPDPLAVGRYHSLAVDPSGLPPELVPTAWAEDGVLMAVRHAGWPMEAVQFHPESVLTPDGPALLRNFLEASLPR